MNAKCVIGIKEVGGEIYHLLYGKNDGEKVACTKCAADGDSDKSRELCANLGAACTSRKASYWKLVKRRYFVGKIFERNGEYEYTVAVLFELEGKQKPEAHMKWMAKNQYGHDREKEGNGWYFNCGEVYVEPREFKEISKATYDELKGFY